MKLSGFISLFLEAEKIGHGVTLGKSICFFSLFLPISVSFFVWLGTG